MKLMPTVWTPLHVEWRSHARTLIAPPRVGLAIGTEAVRGVLLSRQRVLRAVTRLRPTGANATKPESGYDAVLPVASRERDLENLIGEVIDALTPRGARKPRVLAAVGPAAAQIRHLQRLPTDCDSRALGALVRERPERFFLQDGVPIVVSGVEVTGAGECWAAAIERGVLDALHAACRSRRLRLHAIVPSAIALCSTVAETQFGWRDGEHRVLVAVGPRRRIDSCRREPVMGGDLADSQDDPPLRADVQALVAESIGADAAHFADAIGAAMCTASEPLSIRLGDEQWPRADSPSAIRIGIAACALLLALLALVLAPVLQARRSRVAAEHEIATLASSRERATAIERQLETTTASLAELSSFLKARRSMTLFLETLTDALDDDVIVVSLRLDTVGGTLVALAPRGAAVVAQLDSIREITAPEIVGPVTPQGDAGNRMERVTVRFRWRDGVPRESRNAGRTQS